MGHIPPTAIFAERLDALAHALLQEILSGRPDAKMIRRAVILLLRFAPWASTASGWFALARRWPELDSAVDWLCDYVPLVVAEEMQRAGLILPTDRQLELEEEEYASFERRGFSREAWQNIKWRKILRGRQLGRLYDSQLGRGI